MKSTRVCRKCRQPQLLEKLETFMEGNTKRFKCIESCSSQNIPDEENSTLNEQINVESENSEDEIRLELSYTGNEAFFKVDEKQVITTCILGESINYSFCKTLAHYVKHHKASLHIFFKKRYVSDDVSLEFLMSELSELFDEVEYHFHISEDVILNNQLEVRASANVHHTAIRPLSGVKALASTNYLVVPHARQEIEVTVGEFNNEKSLLMSTGCINNLSKGHTQALAKTKFHSVVGAVVYDPLRVDGYGLFTINFSDTLEKFSSFDTTYTMEGEILKAQVDTVYLDDWHSSLVDMQYQSKVKGILGQLKPYQVVSGDVFDGRSVCHHEQNNIAYASNRIGLIEEIDHTKNIIRDLMDNVPTSSFVFLGSNHHNFFSKFFSNPANFKMMNKIDLAESYRALAYLVENTQKTTGGVKYANPMEYFFQDLYKEGWFKYQPAHRTDVKLGFHGCEYKIGINLGNSSNVKGIYGHIHSPQQIKGNVWVGHAMVEHPEYQSGMNNAAHGFCILYSSGKRQLLVDL